MGEIQVHSHLGERFSARIPLNLFPQEVLENGDIVLGGPSDYQHIHLFRSSVIGGLRIRLQSEATGGAVILESDAPVQEPFFNVLIKASRGSGMLVRNYPVLLTLPQGSGAKPIGGQAVSGRESGGVVKQPVVMERREPVLHAMSLPDPVLRESTFGPVPKGQTLADVARIVGEGSGLTPSQVMVGVWQANRDKFYKDNMFGMIHGVVLQLPTVAELGRVSASEAWRLVQVHKTTWRPQPGERATPPETKKTSGTKTTAFRPVPEKTLRKTQSPAAPVAKDPSPIKPEDPAVQVVTQVAGSPVTVAESSVKVAGPKEDTTKFFQPTEGGAKLSSLQEIQEQLAQANRQIEAGEKQRQVLETQLGVMKNQSQSLSRRLRDQALSVENATQWLQNIVLGGVVMAIMIYFGWRLYQRRRNKEDADSLFDLVIPEVVKDPLAKGSSGESDRARREPVLETAAVATSGVTIPGSAVGSMAVSPSPVTEMQPVSTVQTEEPLDAVASRLTPDGRQALAALQRMGRREESGDVTAGKSSFREGVSGLVQEGGAHHQVVKVVATEQESGDPELVQAAAPVQEAAPSGQGRDDGEKVQVAELGPDVAIPEPGAMDGKGQGTGVTGVHAERDGAGGNLRGCVVDALVFSTSESLEAPIAVKSGLGEGSGNALESIPFAFSPRLEVPPTPAPEREAFPSLTLPGDRSLGADDEDDLLDVRAISADLGLGKRDESKVAAKPRVVVRHVANQPGSAS
ncbi:MAG: hypothetical protein HQL66_15440 [Magnetococcales bacterium]|nr:hypothetical protein [Magnetococcales bacterium]